MSCSGVVARTRSSSPGMVLIAVSWSPSALGLQDTAISTIPGLDDLVRATTPLQLMPRAEDYTGHYVLLASEENSRTATGAVINCDGGLGVRGFQKPAGGEDL